MKLCKFVFLLFLFPYIACAQGIDLAGSLTADDEEETYSQPSQEQKQKVSPNNKDKEESFLSSLLNFSFLKKQTDGTAINDDTTANTPEQTKKETPLEKMTRLADGGNLDAQLSLGYMYLYGQDGVKNDFAKAFHYYEMAAEHNNPIALNNLGSLYFNGIGTEVNYKKAIELFAKAAKNGSDNAAVNLAFIFLSSDNIANRHSDAIELFKIAANVGNNTAKFMLGYAYYTGFEVEQNYHTAITLIRDAAKAQFDIAQYLLGVMYKNGQGITKNYGNAVKYMQRAAYQGNVPAMSELGEIYALGEIYPKNEYLAHIYFNIASVYDAPDAATRRDEVEKKLQIEMLLQAQTKAEKFKENPSEITSYVRKTYGPDIRLYIDENIKKQAMKKKGKKGKKEETDDE